MNDDNFIIKERIAPGFWIDQNNNAHVSIPELLVLFDLPDTPEERETVKELVRLALHAHGAGIIVVERDEE